MAHGTNMTNEDLKALDAAGKPWWLVIIDCSLDDGTIDYDIWPVICDSLMEAEAIMADLNAGSDRAFFDPHNCGSNHLFIDAPRDWRS